MIKAKSTGEAWKIVDGLFPTDYELDAAASARAGYDVYKSTLDGVEAWISDLTARLEVNLPDGSSVNVYIDAEPEFREYQIADALQVINEAIYQIDDNILPALQNATGISDARAALYGAFGKIAEIIKRDYPESKLYKQYNLAEA